MPASAIASTSAGSTRASPPKVLLQSKTSIHAPTPEKAVPPRASSPPPRSRRTPPTTRAMARRTTSAAATRRRRRTAGGTEVRGRGGGRTARRAGAVRAPVPGSGVLELAVLVEAPLGVGGARLTPALRAGLHRGLEAHVVEPELRRGVLHRAGFLVAPMATLLHMGLPGL